jgi:hypothetical protein
VFHARGKFVIHFLILLQPQPLCYTAICADVSDCLDVLLADIVIRFEFQPRAILLILMDEILF